MLEAKKSYTKILVFNTAFLGDAILSTPLLRAISKIFPNAKITFIVKKGYEELFLGLPFIENVIGYDKSGKEKGLFAISKLIRRLKEERFDLVLDLHLSLRSSLICLSLGIDSVSYKEASLSNLFTNRIERGFKLKGGVLHEVERCLNLLSPLVYDFKLEEAKLIGGNLAIMQDEEFKKKSELYLRLVSGERRIVGFAPGSVWKTKCYPADRYAEVANKLYKEGFDIALFGSMADSKQVEEMKENLTVPYYDFCYKTNLLELSTLIKEMSLLICNDSGAMHIAVASNIPCVAIFGATVKSLGFSPYDDRSIVVECADLECRPCGKHGGKSCPKGHFKCMNLISSEDVFNTALKVLG